MPSSKAVCPVCKRNLTKSRNTVQCAEKCKQWFHLECVGLNEVDVELMKKMQNKWCCTTCKAKVENQIRSDNVRRSLGVHGPESYGDLVQSIKDLKLEIRDLVKDIKFYAEQYEEQKIKNDEYEKEISNLKMDNKRLNDEISKIKGVAALHDKNDRRANIVVVGVKYEIGEGVNVSKTVVPKIEKVMKYVNPNLKRNDIVIRLSNTKKENCPVIIEFKNKDDKREFLEERKLKGRITSAECGLPGENLTLYFNEDLSLEERNLFKKARGLKQKGFKYVWAKNGNILVRQSDDSPIIKIKKESDIDSLVDQ